MNEQGLLNLIIEEVNKNTNPIDFMKLKSIISYIGNDELTYLSRYNDIKTKYLEQYKVSNTPPLTIEQIKEITGMD